MKEKIPVILCVDTGTDDAIGIAISSVLKFIDIKLIVCDEGNSTIENTTTNTLGVLDIIKAKNIPVLEGYKDKNTKFVYSAHGNSGLSGYIFNKTTRESIKKDSADIIYKTLKENKNTIVFILGPHTSIAYTLKKYPESKDLIKKLVIMSGSIEEDLQTTTPYAEFNVASNPEAAETVLTSGIDTLIVPSEIGRIGKFDYQDIYKIKNTNYTGSFFEILFRNYKHRKVSKGVATCDCVTILSAFYPEMYEIKPVYAFVKYFEKINSGVCLFDFNHKPNMSVCTNINIKKFKKIFFKLLKKLP